METFGTTSHGDMALQMNYLFSGWINISSETASLEDSAVNRGFRGLDMDYMNCIQSSMLAWIVYNFPTLQR